MTPCTRCGFQQNGTQTHCARCGMFLPTLAIYNPLQSEYPVVAQAVPFQQENIVAGPLPATMLAYKLLQTFFAFVGLSISAFGIFASTSNLIDIGLAFLLGVTVLVGGLIFVGIFLFIKMQPPCLQRWQRVVGWLIASAVCVVVMFAVALLFQAFKPAMTFGLGTTIFLYGLTLAALAIW